MYIYIDLGVKKHSTAKDTLFFKKLSVGLNQIQTDGLSQQTVDWHALTEKMHFWARDFWP